jgi:predicted lipoprotein with Yx(FWY)xxD motif
VYEFANDTSSKSTCLDACAAVWLAVAPATVPASQPGVTGKLGETTRPDGSHQLTVAGHPVSSRCPTFSRRGRPTARTRSVDVVECSVTR